MITRELRLNNCQNVAFGHDQDFFVIDLFYFHAITVVENHDVAYFHIQRFDFAVFQDAAMADSQDFATGGFTRRGTGQNDATG